MGPSILVVDDDAAALSGLVELLRSEGYDLKPLILPEFPATVARVVGQRP